VHYPPVALGVTHSKRLRRLKNWVYSDTGSKGVLHRRQWNGHVTNAGWATECYIHGCSVMPSVARYLKALSHNSGYDGGVELLRSSAG